MKSLKLPSKERVEELEQQTPAQLRAMVEARRVTAALGVEQPLVDRAVGYLAAFHALAHDLDAYQGTILGYFNEAEDLKGFISLVSRVEIAPGRPDALDIGIGLRHRTRRLPKADIPALESHLLINLMSGLERSMDGTNIYMLTQPTFPKFLNIPRFQDRQQLLATYLKGNEATHLGDLIPTRNNGARTTEI